jgi:hypothetical protein
MTRQCIAIIAAGGAASRCGGDRPKSLMEKSGTTYLEILLCEISKSGISDILIYCNRLEHLKDIRHISKKNSDARIIVDQGVPSTFHLAKHAASLRRQQDIIFFYGHSPRPSSHISALINSPHQIAASLYETSSKRNPIGDTSDGYLEPPFKIDAELLFKSKHSEWNYFLGEFEHVTSKISVNAPAEFNSLAERQVFDSYISSWSKTISDVPKALEAR